MIAEEWEVRYGKGRFLLPMVFLLFFVAIVFVVFNIGDFLAWQLVMLSFLGCVVWWGLIWNGNVKTEDGVKK